MIIDDIETMELPSAELFVNPDNTYLSWAEPDEGPNGETLHRIVHMSVSDVLKIQLKKYGGRGGGIGYADLLDDFIVTHWAVKASNEPRAWVDFNPASFEPGIYWIAYTVKAAPDEKFVSLAILSPTTTGAVKIKELKSNGFFQLYDATIIKVMKTNALDKPSYPPC